MLEAIHVRLSAPCSKLQVMHCFWLLPVGLATHRRGQIELLDQFFSSTGPWGGSANIQISGKMVSMFSFPEALFWVCLGIFPWPQQARASQTGWWDLSEARSFVSSMRGKCLPGSWKCMGNGSTPKPVTDLPETAATSGAFKMQGGAQGIS